MIIKFCLVFPKFFLLHKVVRDAKKVEKHWVRRIALLSFCTHPPTFESFAYSAGSNVMPPMVVFFTSTTYIYACTSSK